MKVWPVPKSHSEKLPEQGSSGSFWEERDNGYNCGIDLFAPENSEILAIDKGVVLDIGIFTNKRETPYFNDSKYIIIKSDNIIYKYAAIEIKNLSIGNKIEVESCIGNTVKLVDEAAIEDDSPFFLRELVYHKNTSMLHLELYKSPIMEIRPYKNGIYFGGNKPSSILNPNIFLIGLKKNMEF